MKRPSLVLVLAACGIAVALAGCAKKQAATAGAPQDQSGSARGMITPGGAGGATGQMPPDHPPTIEAPPSTAPDAAAGLTWSVPRGWSVDQSRAMRVATYTVPAAGGDSEGGECGVFYFGATQGGDVESNISRWVSQFESPGAPERATRTSHGVTIETVRVSGTYLAPSGPMMQSSGSKPNFELLGAIAKGQQGSVFFKLTGPRKTIDAAKRDFDAMLASIHMP